MPNLTMLSGLPASGKTSTARDGVNRDGNTGRVNRDDLRAMLFNSKFTGKREEVVIEIEKLIVAALCRLGFNAIVDDTNLKQSHVDMWHQVAKDMGMTFAELPMPPFSIDTLESRDQLDGRKSVGRAVIERLALEAGLIQWTGKPIAIFDVDGTLADCAWRRDFAHGTKKDWNKFFTLAQYDEPVEAVVKWAQTVKPWYELVIVSGRPDTYGTQTVQWLRDQGIYFDHIFMRRGSDKRPDTDVKRDILKMMPIPSVAWIADDRNCVCDMWRQFRAEQPLAQYHVFQVAEGNF